METLRQVANIRGVEDRTIRFDFSTEDKDRHKTVIYANGWDLENFNKNGIASFQHEAYGNPDPDMIIGSAKAWTEQNKLVGDITFETEDVNPLADKLFKKVKNGTLNAVSVGFIEKSGHWGDKERSEDEDTYYFDQVELIEISLVTVPSNPNALAYRSFLDEKLKEKPVQKEEGESVDAFHYRMRKLELTALTRGNK